MPLLLSIVLSACSEAAAPTDNGDVVDDGVADCVESRAALDDSDDSLGFSPDDLAGFLEGHLPTSVTWDEVTQDVASEATTWACSKVPSSGATVTRDGDCPAGPDVGVGLRCSFALEDGSGAEDLTVEVAASALDVASVGVFIEADVSLSADRVARGEEAVEADHPGTEIAEWELDGLGTWESTQLDLVAHFVSADREEGGLDVLWRGHWAVP